VPRIDTSNDSVIEIRDMLARKELVVNETYQRGSELWPSGARSYFIDTMLNGFPFPKSKYPPAKPGAFVC